jgi:hypothetical protein
VKSSATGCGSVATTAGSSPLRCDHHHQMPPATTMPATMPIAMRPALLSSSDP